MTPTREAVFAKRLKFLIRRMGVLYPGLTTTTDAWRHMIIGDNGGYADEMPTAWVRLGEGIKVFILDQKERWWQDEVGVVNQVNNFLLLPAGYGFKPDDILILSGVAWVVTEATEQMGVAKLKVSREQANFNNPGRFAPVYRIVGVGASIK